MTPITATATPRTPTAKAATIKSKTLPTPARLMTVTPDEDGTFWVESGQPRELFEEPKRYNVWLGAGLLAKCTCADWLSRRQFGDGTCKHISRVRQWLYEQAMNEGVTGAAWEEVEVGAKQPQQPSKLENDRLVKLFDLQIER